MANQQIAYLLNVQRASREIDCLSLLEPEFL